MNFCHCYNPLFKGKPPTIITEITFMMRRTSSKNNIKEQSQEAIINKSKPPQTNKQTHKKHFVLHDISGLVCLNVWVGVAVAVVTAHHCECAGAPSGGAYT